MQKLVGSLSDFSLLFHRKHKNGVSLVFQMICQSYKPSTAFYKMHHEKAFSAVAYFAGNQNIMPQCPDFPWLVRFGSLCLYKRNPLSFDEVFVVVRLSSYMFGEPSSFAMLSHVWHVSDRGCLNWRLKFDLKYQN